MAVGVIYFALFVSIFIVIAWALTKVAVFINQYILVYIPFLSFTTVGIILGYAVLIMFSLALIYMFYDIGDEIVEDLKSYYERKKEGGNI